MFQDGIANKNGAKIKYWFISCSYLDTDIGNITTFSINWIKFSDWARTNW